jgi:membrane protease YdiL (CAAX protease family)
MDALKAAKARAEHRLAALYFVAACTAAVGLICTAVVFGYWHFTLDVCEGHPTQDKRHCGCLLFAQSSYRLFMGGDTTVCHFVEYSCVPAVVVGLLMGFLHWYRASFVIKRPPKAKRCEYFLP